MIKLRKKLYRDFYSEYKRHGVKDSDEYHLRRSTKVFETKIIKISLIQN